MLCWQQAHPYCRWIKGSVSSTFCDGAVSKLQAPRPNPPAKVGTLRCKTPSGIWMRIRGMSCWGVFSDTHRGMSCWGVFSDTHRLKGFRWTVRFRTNMVVSRSLFPGSSVERNANIFWIHQKFTNLFFLLRQDETMDSGQGFSDMRFVSPPPSCRSAPPIGASSRCH